MREDQNAPTPGVEHIVEQSEGLLLVDILVRIGNDLGVWVFGVDFFRQGVGVFT